MDDFIFIEALEPQMQAQGDKAALIFEGKETSYAALSAMSNKVAHALINEGVSPHSRVAFMGANSAIYFELLLGTQKARAALVGVNSRLAPPEVAYVVNDAQAEMIFVDRNYAPLIEKIIDDCPQVRRVIAMDFDHAD
jgi:acyl-CoA synthetase (AMP-forming)/AMP-acid ligase II